MSSDPKDMPDTQPPTPAEAKPEKPPSKPFSIVEVGAPYRWTKGNAPLSKGRPAGLREKIRELSKDGRGDEIIEIIFGLARDSRKDQVRLDASKYLFERLHGRVPETTIHLEANAGQLAPDLLEALARAILPAGAQTQAPSLVEGEIVEAEAPSEPKHPESLDKDPSKP